MLSISQIVIDCADAAKLAGFWSQVLSRPVDEGANGFFATIGLKRKDGGPALMFLRVPEEKQAKNRLHLDLSGPDWRAEADRLTALGAIKLSEHAEYGKEWITFADPEGNEFDLGAGV
jgi:catechol 2,3-dioxygenase-like lactoylglutathione lyase family enzyme